MDAAWTVMAMARHGNCTPMHFIAASCASTQYPHFCISSLSSHAAEIQANPVQLATTTLRLSIAAAESSLVHMRSRGSPEAAAIQDYAEMMSPAVDKLKCSGEVMRRIGGQSLGDQIDNMRTWVSAALTNADTCADDLQLPSAHVLKSTMMEVVQTTSNALCFINALVAH